MTKNKRLRVRVVLASKGRCEIHVHGVGSISASRLNEISEDVLDFAAEQGVGNVKAIDVDWSAVVGRLCCPAMVDQICRTCSVHLDTADCPDQLVVMWGLRDFGLAVHDGGSSMVEINFCPWCGRALREGRRETA